MEHVHLIGIGGSGLSAIARILLERGISVSGSDRQPSAVTEALQAAGHRVDVLTYHVGKDPKLPGVRVFRAPAVPFYQRAGWTVVSDVFDIPTAGPHHRMTRDLTTAGRRP